MEKLQIKMVMCLLERFKEEKLMEEEFQFIQMPHGMKEILEIVYLMAEEL